MSIARIFQVLFWCALVFAVVMANLPKPPPIPGNPSDDYVHMFAFATLAALLAPAYPNIRLVTLFVGLALLGGAVEIVQALPIIGRTASLQEWVADMLAAGAVLCIIGGYRKLRSGSTKNG